MVNLLLAIHCHQPVGNFDKIFEEAFERAYLPFINVLERHPKIKVALHYSGSLLDWLSSNRSEFIDRLRVLVKNQQVEIFSGGYYEPVLTLIPENDALAQLNLLTSKIKELFSFEAKGVWIAERVWEPKLPKILSKANMEYGVIDDSHFRYVGLNPESLCGFYITEEEGFKFKIFPGSEKLRYLWPFKLPKDSIDYLRLRERSCKGNVTLTFGDDGEKFGLWPGTYKWVYQENWLDNFFKLLEENSSWINTALFSDVVLKNSPTNRVYLPCASYREMMEWSEGFYRNFLVKYPEANNMHKKMLYLSNRLNLIKDKVKPKDTPILKQAKLHLYKSQANDSYWHGVFGGLYLNHLRSSVCHHLIEAQNLMDKLENKKNKNRIEQLDFDCDGKSELMISTKYFNLCLRPEMGASLSFLDYKPKAFNLINTLSRKEEPYHKKIKELVEKKNELKNSESSLKPSSIHDKTIVKEEGLEKILFYDRNPRYCLFDHFLQDEVSLEDFVSAKYRECADFVEGSYFWQDASKKDTVSLEFSRQSKVDENLVKLTKTISVVDNTLILKYLLENSERQMNLKTLFGVEFNLSSFNAAYSKAGEVNGINKFILEDVWNSVRIEFILKERLNLWYFPVETVSESEAGIEKSCQELCLLFWSRINLSPRSNWMQNFKINITESI
ncbi:MAG: DUF1926 domain-containing protein [Candidatus Omnitrophota bacterium]|nr:DUF1926 domain-containing protein [Candidatus Omnitrophota bacterium]